MKKKSAYTIWWYTAVLFAISLAALVFVLTRHDWADSVICGIHVVMLGSCMRIVSSWIRRHP